MKVSTFLLMATFSIFVLAGDARPFIQPMEEVTAADVEQLYHDQMNQTDMVSGDVGNTTEGRALVTDFEEKTGDQDGWVFPADVVNIPSSTSSPDTTTTTTTSSTTTTTTAPSTTPAYRWTSPRILDGHPNRIPTRVPISWEKEANLLNVVLGSLNELAGRELALRQERRINPDVRGVGFCAQEPEFTEIVMFTLASLLAFALMILIGIVLRFLIKMCCLERRISHFYQRSNAEIPLQTLANGGCLDQPVVANGANGVNGVLEQPPPSYDEAAATENPTNA